MVERTGEYTRAAREGRAVGEGHTGDGPTAAALHSSPQVPERGHGHEYGHDHQHERGSENPVGGRGPAGGAATTTAGPPPGADSGPLHTFQRDSGHDRAEAAGPEEAGEPADRGESAERPGPGDGPDREPGARDGAGTDNGSGERDAGDTGDERGTEGESGTGDGPGPGGRAAPGDQADPGDRAPRDGSDPAGPPGSADSTAGSRGPHGGSCGPQDTDGPALPADPDPPLGPGSRRLGAAATFGPARPAGRAGHGGPAAASRPAGPVASPDPADPSLPPDPSEPDGSPGSAAAAPADAPCARADVHGDADAPAPPGSAGASASAGSPDPAGDPPGQATDPPETLDRPLPEDVRRRVVGTAAEAFSSLTTAELPASLRQYARFTPARRAKFAANALAAALEGDPAFRQRVASRVRQAQPDLAGALDTGTVPAAADPLDIAAAAYLLRPAGWTGLVAAAGDEVARAHAERANEGVARELKKAKEELAELRTSSRADADRARTELEAARRESDALQRKVRSAVNDVRRAEAALRKVESELENVRSAAAVERTQADSEARRLRTRLSEAESAIEAGRRAAREGRSVEDMRLRLLLDTVLDAAQGLRRELALPPTTGRPADTVDAVAPGRMTPKDIARRALSEDDPALLDQLLALPQAHLVVDGYNVTKTGYPTMPLEKQRLRLLGGLAALAAQSGAEVTCVFDGADLEAPVLLAPPRGVRVLFSKAGQTADELIRRLVRAEPPGRPVVVVSADREVADGVRRNGARPVASTLLLKRLARG